MKVVCVIFGTKVWTIVEQVTQQKYHTGLVIKDSLVDVAVSLRPVMFMDLLCKDMHGAKQQGGLSVLYAIPWGFLRGFLY